MSRPFPDEIRRRADALLARDFLYDSPSSFRAGVLEALRLVSEPVERLDRDAVEPGVPLRIHA